MGKFASIYELSAPADLTVYDNIVFWAEVEKADGYTVKIDNKEYTVLVDTKFDLDKVNLDAGVHKITVKALGSIDIIENAIYRDSEYCDEIDYRYFLSSNYTLKYANLG